MKDSKIKYQADLWYQTTEHRYGKTMDKHSAKYGYEEGYKEALENIYPVLEAFEGWVKRGVMLTNFSIITHKDDECKYYKKKG